MWAIYKREIKSFFQSVIGWLFLAATLGLFGLYFYVYNLAYGSPYISSTLSATTVIMLIAVPILTMRVLAEERKAKTDQLILTAPVSVGKVVWGKYLAVATIFTIAVAVMAITPVFLHIFGEIPFAECYAAVLGYWLFGMTCIAIGTFVSSITESQVIAAVLTFALLFLGYMMNGITQVISSTGNIVTKILNCFDLTSGMDNFFQGCIDVKSLIYYVSMSVFFLFLTSQSIQKRRWSMSTKKLKLGVFSSSMIAVALVAVVAVNMVATQLPEKLASIDVTSQKLYSITKDTEKMLDNLQEDVTIYVLAKKDSQDTNLEKTLKRYESYSNHVTVEYKDPSVAPTFYKDYTESSPTKNSLIVVGEKRSKVIDYNDIYQYDVDYTTYQQKVTGYDGEGQITSAISYVTSEDTTVMYAITGHEEYSLSGSFTDALEKQNIELKTLNLLENDSVPEDAACLLLLGPSKDYSEDDVTKITNYLENGGKAIIVSNYAEEDLSNFKKILSAYNVTLEDGLVVENDTQHYYKNQYYLLPEIGSDAVTSKAAEGRIFTPFSQGFTYPQQTDDEATASGITYTPLLTTSENSFAKKDVTTASDYSKGENDVDGPFAVGLHVTKAAAEDGGESTELYLFGGVNIFTDDVSQQVYGNNLTLFTGITSQFTSGETENVVPVKSYEVSNLTLTQSAITIGMIIVLILIPLGLLVTGIVIWARRRKR